MRLPKYRRHTTRSLAFVEWHGKRHYLGAWQSPASLLAYRDFLNEHCLVQPGTAATAVLGNVELVSELLSAHLTWAKPRKSAKEYGHLRTVAKVLNSRWSSEPIATFGPKKAKAVRTAFIERGNSRRMVNDQMLRLCRIFRWAVAEELLPPSVYQALKAIPPMREGEDGVRESAGKQAVSRVHVEACLPAMPPMLRAMVNVQMLAGPRSATLCRLRLEDIDRSAPVWIYRPKQHKGQWRGQSLAIAIGPQAQAWLAPYIDDNKPEQFVFRPAVAIAERNAERRAKRKTPLYPSSQQERVADPKRKPRNRYSSRSYRRAIEYAIRRTNEGREPEEKIPAWRPIQLRKLCSTAVRKLAGLEAAQVVLGHQRADVTEVYAQRNLDLAIKVAAEIG